MRWLFGFFGGLFVFVGAACAVAELLLLTVGGADTLYSLADLWQSLHGGSFAALRAGEPSGWAAFATRPLQWALALPSWLVFFVLGGLLMLGGRGGRERTFG